MTGKPQRDFPKQCIQVKIDDAVYRSILPLLKTDVVAFRSLSQLVETIVFLSEHMYIGEADEGFLLDLIDLKATHMQEQVKRRIIKRHRMHVTLDLQAVSFLDMLKRRYAVLFATRSEVLELLLYMVGHECTTADRRHYLGSRLYEVMGQHPVRVK